MKKLPFILLFIAFAAGLRAQTGYPERIDANTSREIRAGEQPLWIITQSQMDSAVATGLAYGICDSTNALLKIKIDKLEQKSILLNEINDTLKKGYDHYVSVWKTCDANLEKTEKKLTVQRKLKYIFGGTGLAAGFLLALLIF